MWREERREKFIASASLTMALKQTKTARRRFSIIAPQKALWPFQRRCSAEGRVLGCLAPALAIFCGKQRETPISSVYAFVENSSKMPVYGQTARRSQRARKGLCTRCTNHRHDMNQWSMRPALATHDAKIDRHATTADRENAKFDRNDIGGNMKMTSPLFQKVDCVRLSVNDLASGLTFYRDQLGLEVVWQTQQAVGLRMPDGGEVIPKRPTVGKGDVGSSVHWRDTSLGLRALNAMP
ncbi:MAG: VOC family protein [bacterium]|nr:VOC family protein [bacterium]